MLFLINEKDTKIFEANLKRIRKETISYVYSLDEVSNFQIDLATGTYTSDTLIISADVTINVDDYLNKYNIKVDTFENFNELYLKKNNSLFNFLNRKKQTESPVYNFTGVEETNFFCNDLFNKNLFMKYLLDNNYISQENLDKVLREVENNKNLNINSHIIEIARKRGYIDDKTSAKILSKVYTKPFISKDTLDMNNLLILNKDYLNTNINFFIKHYNKDKKTLTIILDNETEPSKYIIEDKYIDMLLEKEYLVEGVFEEVKKELKTLA